MNAAADPNHLRPDSDHWGPGFFRARPTGGEARTLEELSEQLTRGVLARVAHANRLDAVGQHDAAETVIAELLVDRDNR